MQGDEDDVSTRCGPVEMVARGNGHIGVQGECGGERLDGYWC